MPFIFSSFYHGHGFIATEYLALLRREAFRDYVADLFIAPKSIRFIYFVKVL